MKEINITKHALMRYASRVHKANIVSDRTWDIWKKANEEKIEVLEISMKEEFKGARYISTAAYEGNKKAEFYINEQILMTYVVVGDNLVTCYPIDYGLDAEGNRAMLKVLLENLKRAEIEENNFEDKYFERKTEINNIVSIANAEISELNKKIEKIKGNKALLEQELTNINLEYETIKTVINSAKEKIVRSKMAL